MKYILTKEELEEKSIKDYDRGWIASWHQSDKEMALVKEKLRATENELELIKKKVNELLNINI
jgi:hypothetical protein